MNSGRLEMGLHKVCFKLLALQSGGECQRGADTLSNLPRLTWPARSQGVQRADVRVEVQETLRGYRIQVRPLCLWELLRDWTDNSDRVVKENEQEYPDFPLSCS